MAAGVLIQVEGLTQLQAKLSPALYTEAVSRLVNGLAMTGERVARENAPHAPNQPGATNALARSIVSEVRPMSAVVYSPLVYARTMEYGRPAGARMPPPNALEGWARRVGMLNGKTDKQVTATLFALARSIGKKGTRGYFYFAKAEAAVRATMPALVVDAANAIRAKWAN